MSDRSLVFAQAHSAFYPLQDEKLIYRVFQKTDPLVYFDDNFGKCGPILPIFSLLQQEIHDAQKLSYFSHLTFIMLPLYLAKQTLMLVSMRIFLDRATKQISMYSNG